MPRRPHKLTVLPETVVDSPEAFDDCLDHLSRCPGLAFDTEFVGEFSYRPELCLVQVATLERLFVIDPYAVGKMDPFWEIVADPKRRVVVHAGREEIRMCRYGIGRPPANVIDVQVAAGLIGLTYPIGYAGMVQEVLGYRLNKGETLTDWRKRPLSPAQLKYAFDDVRYLLPAWKRISDKLNKFGRKDWANEEFAQVVKRALNDEDPTTERWRKVKGIGGFDRRSLAVVRELVAWRDRVAERQNRPARSVVRDDLVAELARRQPRTADEVNTVRGIPKNETHDVLHAIRHAAASPPETWPEMQEREYDAPNLAILTQLLNVVISDFSSRERVAGNLIATQSDLKAVIRSRQTGQPLPDDCSLGRGWRSEAVLPHLLAVLNGSLAVRVVDPKSDSPLGVVSIATPS
ncbi:MAG: ribonuclease D [Gemmataceae bacterium]